MLRTLANVQQRSIKPITAVAVAPGALVHTDERAIYARHEDGDGSCEIHVNTIAGFWPLLRSWLRPHRGISRDNMKDQTLPSPSTGTASAAANFLRRFFDHPAFILPRDFTLFLVGARTDAAIEQTRAASGARAAFEEAYTKSADPWASAAPRYRYQQRKYEQIMALLPARRFRRALDLGCGLGLLSQRLAERSDAVLGIDVASAALGHARKRGAGVANLTFAQGDVLDLPVELNGQFDLVVVADTLYYLTPLSDDLLKALSARLADLLMPGGICLLANHFFFAADPDSKLTRRIHDAFTWSPRFTALSHHRKAFFLATLLAGKHGAAPRLPLGTEA